MKVMLTEDVYTDRDELRDVLRKGNVVTVHIVEHQKNNSPMNGWYLINTGVELAGIYVSDPDVERGDIIQTYRDPNLGNYNVGPYQWIEMKQGQIVHDNNKSAKHLLEKYEWRL